MKKDIHKTLAEAYDNFTKSEEKKKEKIVKGMKKNKDDFKKRYGKDAEAVMYATATKMAKESYKIEGDVKKFKVYVKDPKTGNVKKVNFGHGGSSVKGKSMRIRKNNPKARKSFRARHNCDNPGPKTKARYWSCRKW